MLNDQRINLLISLKLNGEATSEELSELEALIIQDPEIRERFEKLNKVWKQLYARPSGLAELSFEKHLQKLNTEIFDTELAPAPIQAHKTGRVKKLFQKSNLVKLPAAAAALLLLFWFIFKPGDNNEASPVVNNTVSTKAGDKASITLPDGSKVWLNGNSKITYAENLKNKTREVQLSGEAFFEVAKDKTKPFIIHTRTINLKVLGTAFNVRSYDNEKETETALVHGSVEVTLRNSPEQKILLKPGEKLLVKNTPVDTVKNEKKPVAEEETHIAVLTNMLYYGNDSSNIETSWIKNQLVFTDEPLDKIALNLERWFSVRISIATENLKKQKYTATLEENDKLEDFLDALKLTEGFHYTIKNKEVIIRR